MGLKAEQAHTALETSRRYRFKDPLLLDLGLSVIRPRITNDRDFQWHVILYSRQGAEGRRYSLFRNEAAGDQNAQNVGSPSSVPLEMPPAGHS